MFISIPPRSPALKPLVERLWYFAQPLEGGLERVLPDGSAQLLINLRFNELRMFDSPELTGARRVSGAAIQGPSTLPRIIDTAQQREMVGVAFHPGGLRPFCAVGAHELRDDLIDLTDLWGPGAASLTERLRQATGAWAKLSLLQEFLSARCIGEPQEVTASAVAALRVGTRVALLADELGVSARRLAGQFASDVGMTPKRFAAISRFQGLATDLAATRSDGLALLAHRHGYYDQAHMTHEFRRFSGVTPTAYSPRGPDAHNHASLR